MLNARQPQVALHEPRQRRQDRALVGQLLVVMQVDRVHRLFRQDLLQRGIGAPVLDRHLEDEMLLGQPRLRRTDPRPYRLLPAVHLELRGKLGLREHARSGCERLVADFEVEVVVTVHLLHHLADVGHLTLHQRAVPARNVVLPRDVAHTVNVVLDVQGIQPPHRVAVRAAE